MKNIVRLRVLALLSLTSLFAVFCNPDKATIEKKKHHNICVTNARIKPKDTIPTEEKLVGNDSLKWKNVNELTVYFYDGDSLSQKKVLEFASIWSKHCGIKFKKVKYPDLASVRVAFLRKGGYSAAVGTSCFLEEYDNNPTVYLDRLDTLLSLDIDEFRRVVLHEFGHVLGLEHELQSPSANIPWDTAAVYKYFRDHEGWSEEKVYHNLFAKIPNTWHSDFDSTSIMIYGVPDTLTIGDFYIDWPYKLSKKDAQYIKAWYSH